MLRHALLASALAGTMASAAAAETRCGWFANPTPGNFSLTDRHGIWWLAAQGTSGVRGFYDALERDRGRGGWVETNGSYGHGCACLEGEFGPNFSNQVYGISYVETIPLERCARDPRAAVGAVPVGARLAEARAWRTCG